MPVSDVCEPLPTPPGFPSLISISPMYHSNIAEMLLPTNYTLMVPTSDDSDSVPCTMLTGSCLTLCCL